MSTSAGVACLGGTTRPLASAAVLEEGAIRAEVARSLHAHFAREFHTRESRLSGDELDAAMQLVASKYSTPAWINRLA